LLGSNGPSNKNYTVKTGLFAQLQYNTLVHTRKSIFKYLAISGRYYHRLLLIRIMMD